MSKVSVIVPMFKVARYLPDFLGSLDAQEGGLADVELIFVDDGSPDESAQLVTEWSRRTGTPMRLVQKPNGGLCSARNAGMEAATGEWVTFWDPDDILDSWYAKESLDFLNSPEAASVHLVVGRLVWFDDETGQRSEHTLDYRFKGGNRVVDLEHNPEFIHLAANTGYYRRQTLIDQGLTFDAKVVPTFEDGHLTARYLGKFERPRIAFRADALYLYRRRADQSSLVQTGWSKETKYSHQPKYGWLDLLKCVQADRGRVPRWAQHLVLYELQWYYKAQRTVPIRTAWVPEELLAEFHAVLDEVVGMLDEDYIENFPFSQRGHAVDLAAALTIGIKGSLSRPNAVTADQMDTRRHVVRFRYYFGGELPVEEFRADGVLVKPKHVKTRRIDVLGRTLAFERCVWLPASVNVSVRLDGVPMPVRVGALENTRYEAGPAKFWRTLGKQAPPKAPGAPKEKASASPSAAGGRARKYARLARRVQEDPKRAVVVARKKARKVVVGQLVGGKRQRKVVSVAVKKLDRFESVQALNNAWLLMDKDTHANDNAEHLYRYLHHSQPAVNAWFVLNRDSVDWDRLEAEGFRLIPHGSRRHTMALLNARHLLSSHADHYVVKPLDKKGVGNGNWRFTFLQHGVTMDDLSTWLNGKPIDLVICATPDEQATIVADGTAYRFNTLDTPLTGFPRHDRLWRLGESTPPQSRRRLLFMPTWRVNLLGDRIGSSNARVLREDFWETNYAKAWRQVLESDRLRKAAATHNYEITFVPHPNMQDYLHGSPLPDHIAVHRFADIDVQQTIAEAALLVSDYSSLAFEAAYLNRPVVYYQFDEKEFFSGEHVYTKGTWSYRDDGFGPVCTEAEETLDAIVNLVESDCAAASVYAQRMAKTFPFRDGECSRRTYEAVAALDRPIKPKDMYERLEK
ncbi:MAG: bifunctional glycosyltransferase/CDP-glycerol:glycerophosphate glycerophosphotransferase [Sporichthyaceae bacterium]